MTDHPKEPTAKQWKRRALRAEQELKLLQDHETSRELRNIERMRGYDEALNPINWALEQQA